MLERGESVFVTGIAGSGKTTILKKVLPFLEVLDPRMGVCATTGVAASLLGGVTLHSWLGLVPEVVLAVASELDVEDVVARLPLPARLRICSARFLIVDEISMLDAALLDGVDRLCRHLRRAPSTPLGGIVVLFCGDFLQLAPVQGQGALSGQFSLQADVWPMLFGPRAVVLTTAGRHGADAEFRSLLLHMRRAELTPSEEELLRSRVVATAPDDAVYLYSTTEAAKVRNNKCLVSLDQPLVTFVAEDDYKQLSDRHGKQLLADYTKAEYEMKLCVGAVVLLACNAYFHAHGLSAGARGVVIGFYTFAEKRGKSERLPIVDFLLPTAARRRLFIKREMFCVTSLSARDKEAATRRQVPLVLGWAMTIHKAQGMTLDTVVLSLGRVFTFAMVYVAFSRVRRLQDVFLLSFDASRVSVCRRALEFHDRLHRITS